jgi:hypothetical protein
MATGACTVKLFTAVIIAVSLKARVFAAAIHFHPSLIFAGKGAAIQSGAPYRTQL